MLRLVFEIVTLKLKPIRSRLRAEVGKRPEGSSANVPGGDTSGFGNADGEVIVGGIICDGGKLFYGEFAPVLIKIQYFKLILFSRDHVEREECLAVGCVTVVHYGLFALSEVLGDFKRNRNEQTVAVKKHGVFKCTRRGNCADVDLSVAVCASQLDPG